MSALDLTREWLRNVLRPYAAKDRIEREVMDVLGSRRTLSVKTDAFTFDSGQTALLLLLHGTLPITFRGATYQIPVHLWIPHAYPAQPPLAFVVPTKDMGVRKGREVEPGGRVREDVVAGWWGGWSDPTVEQLLGQLAAVFSVAPPVYAKPPERAAAPLAAAGPNGTSSPIASASTGAGPSHSRSMSNSHPAVPLGPDRAPLPPARPFASPPPLSQPPYHPHPDSLPTYRPAPTPPPVAYTPPPQPHTHAQTHSHSHSRQTSAQYPAGPSRSPPVPQRPEPLWAPTRQGSLGLGSPVSPGSAGGGSGVPPRPGQSYHDQLVSRTPTRPVQPGPPIPGYAGGPSGEVQGQQPAWQGPQHLPPQGYGQHPQQQLQYGGPGPQTPYPHSAPEAQLGPQQSQSFPQPQSAPPPQPLQRPQPPVAAARPAAPDLMSSSSPESSFTALPPTSSPAPAQPPASISVAAGPPPIPPSKPPPPSLLHLHSILLPHLTAALPPLLHSLHATRTHLLERKEDLESGEPAIRDEMARLEAVKKVCDSVGRRMDEVVRAGGERVADLEQRGEVGVDEVVCGISIVHNQLIELVAEDNAIEDTIYHMTRALDAERVDLDRFLKSIRSLAREQYMKRALIERILEGMGQKQGW